MVDAPRVICTAQAIKNASALFACALLVLLPAARASVPQGHWAAITVRYLLSESMSSIPFHSIPFHSIPFHSIPFHSMPFHSTPFRYGRSASC